MKATVTEYLVSFKHQGGDIWLVIYFIEAVWIIVLNAITIITFCTSRRAFSRAVYMLINLSASDMIYGCSIFMLCIYLAFPSTGSSQNYMEFLERGNIFIFFLLGCAFISGTSLVPVAVDRVFATFFPFRYRTVHCNYYVTVFGINLSLCLGIVIGRSVSPRRYAEMFGRIFTVIMVLSLVTLFISYTTILINLRSQRQLTNITKQAARLRERKMAYTVMLVTLCSFLTWLPIFLTFAFQRYISPDVLTQIYGACLVIQASNSFINPVIYALRVRLFRKALFQLLCRCTRYRVQPMVSVGLKPR